MDYRRTCTKCGEDYLEWENAESKLLSIIFGEEGLCKHCSDTKGPPSCTECNQPAKDPVNFNGKDYCTEHLPQDLGG